MRSTLIAVVVLMLGSTAVWAQRADQRNEPAGRRGMMPQPMTPADEKEAVDWAKERMPNLHRLIEQNRRPSFLRIARMRYRGVKQAENRNDTEGLGQMYKNVKSEDQVFGYIIELDKAKPEDKPALREKIRTSMKAVFEGYIAQRAERIERLEERLADEKQQLENERAKTDALVDQQLDRFGVYIGATTRESSEPPASDVMAAPRAQ